MSGRLGRMTFIVTRQRAQEVHDWARARAGLPYAYGGAFTENPHDSTDCSGLVLQTGARYIGRTDWPGNRYGSTESFRLDYKIVYDLGFRRMPAGGPAALPFKPVMLVGLQHGGGGEYSHTACTLMTMDIPGGPVKMSDRGVDWESQGDGVFLYDGARAWNDPLFHDFWYLDAKLEDAPADDDDDDLVDVLARAMAPTSITRDQLAAYLPHFSEAMRAAEINTVRRAAAWCSQVGHESAGLKYMAEIQTSGPDWSEDRTRYRGRGPIQLTWSSNYRKFGQWCKAEGYVDDSELFVRQPELVEQPRWGFLAASWYWLKGGPRPGQINGYADAGGILAVSRCVNGWIDGQLPVGWNDNDSSRLPRWNRCLELGDQLLALVAGNTPADPLEELLMMELDSLSPFATPGEPKIPASLMLQAVDAIGHRLLVLDDAELGDEDAIFRLVRASRGQGKYTDPANVRKWKNALTRFIRSTAVLAAGGDPTAVGILAHMQEKYPAELQEFVNRKGQ